MRKVINREKNGLVPQTGYFNYRIRVTTSHNENSLSLGLLKKSFFTPNKGLYNLLDFNKSPLEDLGV